MAADGRRGRRDLARRCGRPGGGLRLPARAPARLRPARPAGRERRPRRRPPARARGLGAADRPRAPARMRSPSSPARTSATASSSGSSPAARAASPSSACAARRSSSTRRCSWCWCRRPCGTAPATAPRGRAARLVARHRRAVRQLVIGRNGSGTWRAHGEQNMVSAGTRVAAVTGGSAGIGLAICERLLAEGCEVVSLARRRCPIEHPRLNSLEVDLMDRAATAAAATELARRFEVTTLVHNAGVIRPALRGGREARGPRCARRAAPRLRPAAAAGGAARHARGPLRPRRAAVVARRGRPGDAHRLLGDQGRHARHGADLGARAGARRHHGQRRRAGAGAHRHVLRRRARGQRQGTGARRVGSGPPARRAGRRGTGGELLRQPRGRLRHRPGALRLRRHQRRQPDLSEDTARERALATAASCR